jgi:endonuclease-3
MGRWESRGSKALPEKQTKKTRRKKASPPEETTAAPEVAALLLDRLEESYPNARVELDYTTPLELLVATILSAQCTDKRVNAVTPALFSDYPDARSFAEADTEVLQEAIRSTGFFRQKTKSIQACCARLVEDHGGEVPDDLDLLTTLPGVGRKTASVVMAVAFGQPAIAVDTHCRRVSQRLGLSVSKNPDLIERDLSQLYPQDRWATISKIFIWHGRYTCKARRPLCEECPVPDLCPFYLEGGA